MFDLPKSKGQVISSYETYSYYINQHQVFGMGLPEENIREKNPSVGFREIKC